MLDKRFIAAVRTGGRFTDWPLERIVPERDAFFRFLAERWPRFVLAQLGYAVESGEAAFQLNGPANLPFSHEDVRVVVDTLFLEGRLPRATGIAVELVRDTWMAVGVEAGDVEKDSDQERLVRLAALLADSIPAADASYLAWGQAARRYHEWLAALRECSVDIYGSQERMPSWRVELENRFTTWMLRRFGGLASVPPFPRPVMVHHVPSVMARELRTGTGKVAILVMDGMSGSQWSSLRASLAAVGDELSIDEDVVFAWVPTITSVSRQALLAGEPPLYFAQSLGTTQKDEARWRAFWQRESIPVNAVAHVGQRESESDDLFLARVRAIAHHPGVRALAVTCTAVDRMVHGAVGGERGLHAQVIHWAADGHFRNLVCELLDSGFTVHVTADHGSTPVQGIGRPKVGDTPEVRGERVLVFAHEALRSTAAATTGGLEWPSVGLPEDYFALLAPSSSAFTTVGASIIGHGGISIEEVVVPYARIGRVA
jgi:hypothetical protein